MSRHLLTHVAFASLIIACGATKPSGPDGEDPSNPANARIRLTVQGPTRITLPPTRSATIRVAATLSQGGTPVQGLAVKFALQGAGAGSSLSFPEVSTDDDGIALVNFTAGTMNATTRVLATAKDAAGAQVDVVIDGAAASVVNGNYEFSTVISPLEFMNRNTKTYAYTSNVVNFLVNPATAILEQWLEFNETSQTTVVSSWAYCNNPGTDFGKNALCIAAKAAFPVLLDYVLSLDGSGTATMVEAVLSSAGNLVKSVNVGGTLNVKTWDQTSQSFTGTLSFDTYRLLWTGGSACTGSTDACCGHSLFDATKLGLPPFMKMCPTQADAAQQQCTADLTGKIIPTPGQKGRYTLSLDQGALAIAYGTMVKAGLEGGVFPSALSETRFPRDANGRVSLQTFFNGLASCGGAPGGSQPACSVWAAVITPLVQVGLNILDGLGNSDTFANARIDGASLIDTNNDGQADSLTGALTVTTAGTGNTGTQTPAINGVFANSICSGDATCGTGRVCKFARDTIDACFARNQCAPLTGTKQGYADCSTSSECQSGICIQANASSNFSSPNVGHCFQACAQDSDCSGGRCDMQGYVSVEGNGATTTGTCVR